MFCMNCGKELQEGVRFCDRCGTPTYVENQKRAPLPPERKSGKKKIVLPVVLSLILLLMIAGGIAAFFLVPGLRCRITGHQWVEATCTKRGYCEICGESGEKKKPHDYDENGICRECGKKNENAAPAPETAAAAPAAAVAPAAEAAAEPALPESVIMPDENRAKAVGISMPTGKLQRWNQDGANMKKELELAGYEVDLRYADNDVYTQVNQVEDLIAEGCSVLIIAAIDGSSLEEPLDKAMEAGIPVIAYDRLIINSHAVSYYVTFDNYMVGTIQARYVVEALDLNNAEGPFNIEFTAGAPDDYNAKFFFDGAYDVLKPYIDEGKLVVRSGESTFDEAATQAWSTDTARSRAANIIRRYYDGNDIDAWICSNDSTALGVEYALNDYYYGNYPVITGQDCDIESIKNIIAGKQAMSVFKDTRTLASQTVRMAGQILSGEPVDFNDVTTYNNGVKTIASYLCAPVYADIFNYKELMIDSGYYSEDQLK